MFHNALFYLNGTTCLISFAIRKARLKTILNIYGLAKQI